jgi:hypothetical protein
MNPATKKTLSDCFPLLCKRFKQRDQRHMVEKEKTNFEMVSAENLGYGDQQPDGCELWGEANLVRSSSCSDFVGYRPHFVRLLTKKDGKGWDEN